MDNITKLVTEEKTKEYGDATESLDSCARFWNLGLRRLGWIRDKDLTAIEVCELMIMFKLSRNMGIIKQDNITDVQGYGRIMDMLYNKEKSNETK